MHKGVFVTTVKVNHWATLCKNRGETHIDSVEKEEERFNGNQIMRLGFNH